MSAGHAGYAYRVLDTGAGFESGLVLTSSSLSVGLGVESIYNAMFGALLYGHYKLIDFSILSTLISCA